MSAAAPREPLGQVTSIKVKLGLLVAASVLVAAVLATLGRRDGAGLAEHPGHGAARARPSPSCWRSG